MRLSMDAWILIESQVDYHCNDIDEWIACFPVCVWLVIRMNGTTRQVSRGWGLALEDGWTWLPEPEETAVGPLAFRLYCTYVPTYSQRCVASPVICLIHQCDTRFNQHFKSRTKKCANIGNGRIQMRTHHRMHNRTQCTCNIHSTHVQSLNTLVFIHHRHVRSHVACSVHNAHVAVVIVDLSASVFCTFAPNWSIVFLIVSPLFSFGF